MSKPSVAHGEIFGEAHLVPRAARLPAAPQRILPDGRSENWECELAYFDHKPFQFTGLLDEAASTNECPPLDCPCWIGIERASQPNRFGFDFRSAVPEGGDD